MYDLLTPWVVKVQQDELLEKAKEERTHKITRAASPSPWERLFVHIGDVLITAGQGLHQRYQAAT